MLCHRINNCTWYVCVYGSNTLFNVHCFDLENKYYFVESILSMFSVQCSYPQQVWHVNDAEIEFAASVCRVLISRYVIVAFWEFLSIFLSTMCKKQTCGKFGFHIRYRKLSVNWPISIELSETRVVNHAHHRLYKLVRDHNLESLLICCNLKSRSGILKVHV